MNALLKTKMAGCFPHDSRGANGVVNHVDEDDGLAAELVKTMVHKARSARLEVMLSRLRKDDMSSFSKWLLWHKAGILERLMLGQ